MKIKERSTGSQGVKLYQRGWTRQLKSEEDKTVPQNPSQKQERDW